MSKSIKKITKKLRTYPIISLGRDEVCQYFSYRLDMLLQKKQIITKGELRYLFGETGPGFFRIDPDILSSLTNEKYYIYKIISSLKDDQRYSKKINKIVAEKIKIENAIKSDCRLLGEDGTLRNILKGYISDIVFDTQKNIYLGKCHDIPVCIIFGNGKWLMPNHEIVNFLSTAKKMEALPVFVYKKIYGGLFPLFKQVSALGLSTYVTFVSHKTLLDFRRFNIKYEINEKKPDKNIEMFPFFRESLLYNDRIYDARIAVKDAKKRQELHFHKFFEEIIPKLGPQMHGNFLKSNLNMHGSFSDLVNSIKIRKVKNNILRNHNSREELLRSLAYLTPATQI